MNIYSKNKKSMNNFLHSCAMRPQFQLISPEVFSPHDFSFRVCATSFGAQYEENKKKQIENNYA